ncbi:MAG: cysteine desulfurase family protein [Patescibacteria group bacterium]
MKRIYLDNAASTPTDPRVLIEMMPYFQNKYGNASSIHFFGQEAQSAIDDARRKTADFLNCDRKEIFFTGSATESNNLAIIGAIRKFKKEKHTGKPHIIISQIEHESVLESVRYLTEIGEIESTLLSVSDDGIILLDELEINFKDETILISIMHANNEIGAIQPIREISQIIRKFNKEKGKNILFHTDAVQSVNFLDCDVADLGIDMLTISGHKIYGPKGVGVLFVKSGTNIEPLILGSKQELGMRSGTENIPSIVGIGVALDIVKEERKNVDKISKLRDELMDGILTNINNSKINGTLKKRLPNNINVSISGINKDDIIIALDLKGVAISGGSACYSKTSNISHVLDAIGLSQDENESSIRITLGRHITQKDIKKVIEILKEAVISLKNKISK